jgi:copper chaperone CopZ
MKTMQFKTNINCGGCVAKVTTNLNEMVGEGHWKVDTQNPEKVLTLDSDRLREDEIIKSLEIAGFKAVKIE